MIPDKPHDFYGDNVRWFLGTVIDINDPEELGRIKVRIEGIHGDEITDEQIPWAQTVLPINQGGTKGLGIHTGIQNNARVVGFFIDSVNSQVPIVFGSLPKYEDNSPGGRSSNLLARGTNTLKNKKETARTNPNSVIDEPASPYNAEYPYNHVQEFGAGHVIEIDETPGAERIHIYHSSGSFVEFHPNGDVVSHHKNGYKTIVGNDKIHISGNLEVKVDGNVNFIVNGDYSINTNGKIYLN